MKRLKKMHWVVIELDKISILVQNILSAEVIT